MGGMKVFLGGKITVYHLMGLIHRTFKECTLGRRKMIPNQQSRGRWQMEQMCLVSFQKPIRFQ